MQSSAASPKWGLLTVVCLVALLAASAGGQQPDQEPSPEIPLPQIRATARMVLVDVVVRDGEGRLVADLTADDFTVLEDGRAQRIAAFSRESVSRQRAARPGPPPLPPGIFTNRPEYAQPPGPLVILLLDGLNTAAEEQAFVRQQVLDYVDRHWEPGQRLAVFMLGRHLTVVQDFTDDREMVRVAVENLLRGRSGMDVSTAISRPMDVPTLAEPGVGMIPADRARLEESLAETRAAVADQRVGVTLGALGVIARAMAGLPGRKSLVWISSSFPVIFDADEYGQQRSYRTYADQTQNTASLLASAQVAVYPVDARGLIGFSLVKPDLTPLFTDPALTTAEESSARWNEALARREQARFRSHDTMRTLADVTGGSAFTERNDIAVAVGQAIADGSAYYLLAYYPENRKWDGRYRSIEVRVNRPDVQLRYRKGYYAVDFLRPGGDRRTRERELLAAVDDPLPANLISFFARVPPPAPADPAEVKIQLLADAHTLSFQPTGGGGQRVDLECVATAFAPDGEVAASRHFTLRGTLTRERHEQAVVSGLPLQVELKLKPGRYRVRLVVRDNHTGWLGALDVPLHVPSSD
jgi:VWFA-related protein